MASNWGDSWGQSWGDSWGELVAGSIAGHAAGAATCSATLTPVSAEVISITGGVPRRRPRTINKPINFQPVLKNRRDEEEALLVVGLL